VIVAGSAATVIADLGGMINPVVAGNRI
jgi:hypothetical protein